jgi:hypothetical protein
VSSPRRVIYFTITLEVAAAKDLLQDVALLAGIVSQRALRQTE